MSNFDLKDYKTVPERIAEAKTLYPDGRFQTELLTLPTALADRYIAVKARFFRDASDPIPGEGVAWEVVPGKTPYTKDSELQNCETSAWGRALVAAFAVDASKGIASREEIQARQPQETKRQRSGPQQRTPRSRPTATETAPEAPSAVQVSESAGPSREAPDIELVRWVAKQKLALLDGLAGDKEKAKTIWADVLSTYGLDPGQLPVADSLPFLESDLSIAMGEALMMTGHTPESDDEERPF